LNEEKIDYLLIGGYAVGYYGYPRTTADMDIWIAPTSENAAKIVSVMKQFGMQSPEIKPELFLSSGNIVRMGVPPMRIEILNEIDGVKFDECYKNHELTEMQGVTVKIISLHDLLINKKASARYKDLDDIENLPEP
jgi:predicted nucleotidyltransferase